MLVHIALLFAALAGAARPAPRAEVQVALCEPIDALTRKLALTTREAPYEIWQFDDAKLTLLDHGVRARLRMKAQSPELTIKLAGQDCDRMQIRRRAGKCEFDVYDGKAQGALSVTRNLEPETAQALLAGKRSLASVLDAAQRQSLREIAKAWPLPPDLRALGPIVNATYSDGDYALDVNTMPDGRRYAEIGIKVPYDDFATAQHELDAHLASHGVTACADQRGQAAEKLRQLANP